MDQGPPQNWQILALWYWFQFSLGLWRAASIIVLSFSTPRNQLREKKELREFLAFAVNLTPMICSNWHDFPNRAPCHFADWFAASIKTQQMILVFFFLFSFSLVRSPPYFLSLFFFCLCWVFVAHRVSIVAGTRATLWLQCMGFSL